MVAVVKCLLVVHMSTNFERLGCNRALVELDKVLLEGTSWSQAVVAGDASIVDCDFDTDMGMEELRSTTKLFLTTGLPAIAVDGDVKLKSLATHWSRRAIVFQLAPPLVALAEVLQDSVPVVDSDLMSVLDKLRYSLGDMRRTAMYADEEAFKAFDHPRESEGVCG